jgi:hypothetical protein
LTAACGIYPAKMPHKGIVGQSGSAHPACLLVLYKSTVRSVIEYDGVCFSGMSDFHMRRPERIQWGAERICFGQIRSTHALSVEVLAGLPPIRQMLSFLNERLLVSALVKPNDLLMVRCSGSFRDQPPSIPTVQRPRVWSDLGYFWMTKTRTVLDTLA